MGKRHYLRSRKFVNYLGRVTTVLFLIVFLNSFISLSSVEGMDAAAARRDDEPPEYTDEQREEIEREIEAINLRGALEERASHKNIVTLRPFRYEDKPIEHADRVTEWVRSFGSVRNAEEDGIAKSLRIGPKNYAFIGVSAIHEQAQGSLILRFAKSRHIFISGTRPIVPASIVPREDPSQEYASRAWECESAFEGYLHEYLKPLFERVIQREDSTQNQRRIARYYLNMIGRQSDIAYAFGHTENEILAFLRSPGGAELIAQAVREGQGAGETPKAITLHVISRYDMCEHCFSGLEQALLQRSIVQELRDKFGVDYTSIPFNIVFYGRTIYSNPEGYPTAFFADTSEEFSIRSRQVGRPRDLGAIELSQPDTITHVALGI